MIRIHTRPVQRSVAIQLHGNKTELMGIEMRVGIESTRMEGNGDFDF